MHKQPSGAVGDIKGAGLYRKQANDGQDGYDIHGQPDNTGKVTEQQHSHIHNRGDKKEADRDEEYGMEYNTPMGQAHAGIKENELADTLAKKAAQDKTMIESYKRVSKSVVAR